MSTPTRPKRASKAAELKRAGQSHCTLLASTPRKRAELVLKGSAFNLSHMVDYCADLLKAAKRLPKLRPGAEQFRTQIFAMLSTLDGLEAALKRKTVKVGA
jgi:hypothetical protein